MRGAGRCLYTSRNDYFVKYVEGTTVQIKCTTVRRQTEERVLLSCRLRTSCHSIMSFSSSSIPIFFFFSTSFYRSVDMVVGHCVRTVD